MQIGKYRAVHHIVRAEVPDSPVQFDASPAPVEALPAVAAQADEVVSARP